jgi:chromosome segregation ATPase
MDELTKAQVQTALANATDEIEALHNHIMERDTEIDNLTAALSAEQGKNKALQQIAADLNRENVGLKQRIAQLESGRKQTVYPWKAE